MGLVNPQTGMPFRNQKQPLPHLNEEKLIEILTAQDMKIQYLNQQNMHLGLYLEFIVDALQAVIGTDGNPLIVINIKEFPEFAEKRFAEIQAEIAEKQAEIVEQTAEDIVANMERAKENLGINLNE